MMAPRAWILAVLVTTISATVAFARPGQCGPPTAGKEVKEKPVQATQQQETSSEDTPRRSIQMGEIQIRGEVEKPKAMFIIPHTPTDYSFLKGGKKDFSKEILAPIDMQWAEDMAKHPEFSR